MRTSLVILMLIGITIMTGCRPTAQPEPDPKKSTLNTFIDGATGKTAVEAGKRTQDKIEEISARHNAELNEILGE